MITEIRTRTIAANDARLEGRISREQHAVIIAGIDAELSAAGFTWGRPRISYRVYHLTRLIVSFPTRDEALTFIEDRVTLGDDRDDFEILDQSDLVAS